MSSFLGSVHVFFVVRTHVCVLFVVNYIYMYVHVLLWFSTRVFVVWQHVCILFVVVYMYVFFLWFHTCYLKGLLSI